MNFEWVTLKDVFYTFGSIAGAFAFFRPLVESKMQRDTARVERIKALVNEKHLVDLERRINGRQVPIHYFWPFDQIADELRTSQDGVRFSGPCAKYLTQELRSLIEDYQQLRKYIQVPEWELQRTAIGDAVHETWDFNKRAFEDQDGIPRRYADHLYAAEIQAGQMLKAFQRFQIVAELHFFETPLAKWLLRRRFKARAL